MSRRAKHFHGVTINMSLVDILPPTRPVMLTWPSVSVSTRLAPTATASHKQASSAPASSSNSIDRQTDIDSETEREGGVGLTETETCDLWVIWSHLFTSHNWAAIHQVTEMRSNYWKVTWLSQWRKNSARSMMGYWHDTVVCLSVCQLNSSLFKSGSRKLSEQSINIK